jgi:hypothetical protein
VLALSIRQPYAELILLGKKVTELRSRPTLRRGKVYLYAPKTVDRETALEAGFDLRVLPTGVVLGTVEIVGCERQGARWAWYLESPQRLPTPLVPNGRPQPVWFQPFRGR